MLYQLQNVFESLQKHQVKYLVIGGIASVYYGVPRSTFDIDFLIKATKENAQRLIDAFLEAHIFTASLTTSEDVISDIITIFNDRVRIDVKTKIPGVNFLEAWTRKKIVKFEGTSFYMISYEDLISSKQATGRQIDLEDVRILQLRSPDQSIDK